MKIMIMRNLRKLIFLEKEVTKCIVKDKISIICLSDEDNYYLSKLMTDIY